MRKNLPARSAMRLRTAIIAFFLLVFFRPVFAQNYSSLFLANANTTGALQNPLNLGNWSSPTTVPSFNINTSDNGTSSFDLHSTRWGSSVSFTRSDPTGNSYYLAQIGGINGQGATFNLFNGSTRRTSNSTDRVLHTLT